MSAIQWTNSWNIDGSTRHFTSTLGSVHTNVLLTLQPKYVSSVVYSFFPGIVSETPPDMNSVASVIAHGGADYMQWMSVIKFGGGYGYELASETRPVNWASVAVPAPTAYYLNPNGAFGCDLDPNHPQCSTIFEGAYFPMVDVGHGLKTIDAAWTACADAVHGLYDPPIALQPANSVQGPSYPTPSSRTSSTSAPASPSSSQHAPTPPATSTPVAYPDSTTASDSSVATARPASYTAQPSSFVQSTHADDPSSNDPGTPNTEHNDPSPESSGTSTPAEGSALPQYSSTTRNAAGHAGQPSPTAIGDPIGEPQTTPKTSQSNVKPEFSYSPADPEQPTTTTNALSVLESAIGSTEAPQEHPVAATGPSGVNSDSVATIITAGNDVFTASQAAGTLPAVAVGDTTLSQGGSALVTNGHTLSAASPGLVIDSSTIAFPLADPAVGPGPAKTQVSIGGNVVTISRVSGAEGAVVIGGTTLSQGGPALVTQGQIVSVGSQGIVLGGTTVALPAADPQATTEAPSTITYAGHTYTVAPDAGSNNIVVDGSFTLSAGGAAISMNGQDLSADPAGLVLGSSTIPLAMDPLTTDASRISTVMTIDGQTFTAVEDPGASNAIVFDESDTLTAGGSAQTIAGHIISVGSSMLVIDASSYTLANAASSASGASTVISADGAAFTAVQEPGSSSVIVVDGSITLTAGGSARTIDGHTISAEASILDVDGSTFALPNARTTGGSLTQTGSVATPAGRTSDAAGTPSANAEANTSGVAKLLNSSPVPAVIFALLANILLTQCEAFSARALAS